MSGAWQPGNGGDGRFSRRLLLVGSALSPLFADAKPWTDPHTGLALAGYDAVSYYETDGPKAGDPRHEAFHDDAYWRFHNQGNKAAFLAHPDSYMPQFGGHDMVLLSAGKLTAGHPLLWRIISDRLYLFFSDRQLQQFDIERESLMAEAKRNWAILGKTQY